ncbi:MAG TPA: hypothetical protein VNG35_14460 [Gemmatimonadales bacterium]|nr:hypothetical protein [Gemmatimonadales bacterium]
MSVRGIGVAAGVSLLVATAVPLQAQALDSATAAARSRLWLPPLASLVAPGAGQLITGRDRGLVYIAAEVYLLSRYLELQHDGHHGSERYRELAFTVAQRGFATMRRDTVFEYYETLERFTSSGVFDRNPSGVFTPENDPNTYNGTVWLLAQRTFFPDPANPPAPGTQPYIDAINFYRAHAIGPNFQWSWATAPLELEEYRATIRGSDNAFRNAQNQLGLLLANHLASAIDALISSRLSATLRRPASLQTSYLGEQGAVVSLTIAF